MNVYEILILINGKDCTQGISHYRKLKNGSYAVTFFGGKHRYTYRTPNIEVCRYVEVIPVFEYDLYDVHQKLENVNKALVFNQTYIKVFFQNQTTKLYTTSEIKCRRKDDVTYKNNNVLRYLQDLSEIVGIKDDQQESLLKKQFKKIKTIPRESVLHAYLRQKNSFKTKPLPPLLYPFGFNKSQAQAVTAAFQHRVSIIEGPPGTGKTQTILNIIANAIMNHKHVAVVSNNNSALTNIIAKLNKQDIQFIAAFLGNKENQTTFIASQQKHLTLPRSWQLEPNTIHELKRQLEQLERTLAKVYDLENKQAIHQQILENVETEFHHFERYMKQEQVPPISLTLRRHVKATKTFPLIFETTLVDHGYVQYTPFRKIKNFFLYGISPFHAYSYSNQVLRDNLKYQFYTRRLQELSDTIAHCKVKLAQYQAETLKTEYHRLSTQYFLAVLYQKYAHTKRTIYTKEDIRKHPTEFMKQYPVILSSTHSLKYCMNQNFLYDYVIVDEASQVDLVTGALTMSCAKNIVIVGDENQLPSVIPNNVIKQTNHIFEQYHLKEAYRYTTETLLSSCKQIFSGAPVTLLREHYRCHPKIIDFCNKKFYRDQLIILNQDASKEAITLYKTVPGHHQRGHYNQRQIDIITTEILPRCQQLPLDYEIGIITPYRLQRQYLTRTIPHSNIEIDTVHKFQGCEKDVIILSTVADEKNPFVDDPQLLNVAVSRAIHQLYVIADENLLKQNPNISDLADYIDYHNLGVVDSKIYSVFDQLGTAYTAYLRKRRYRFQGVSPSPAEILMYDMLVSILKELNLHCLEINMHTELKTILQKKDLLTERERKLVNHGSHLDFVISNKVSKKIILTIEVDGFTYHQDPKQQERDAVKTALLSKYQIPLLRFNTVGSNERDKVIAYLKQHPM